MKHHPLYATLAGFCLIAIGLCLCRYAYTPLIPSMIDGHWVTKPGAGYLGGFNCLGYLLGCLAALFLRGTPGVRILLRASLLLAVIGQTMSAWNLGFVWLATGRFLTGLAGASLVIHTPSVILQHVPERWHKAVSGFAFAGAGAAIVFISLMLPRFLTVSVTAGWLFEATLTLLAAVVAWPITRSASSASHHRPAPLPGLSSQQRRALYLLGIAYYLAAISITPHTLFLTDYLHASLGTSTEMSSRLFSLVGAGCLVGSFTSGLIARLLGTPRTLAAVYLAGTIAVLIVLLTDNVTLITLSAFMIGFFLLSCVPLTSIRSGEISGLVRHAHDWGLLTLLFGLGLATGSYGMSGLLSLGLSYYQLFMIAQITISVSLLLSVWLLFLHRSPPEAAAGGDLPASAAAASAGTDRH